MDLKRILPLLLLPLMWLVSSCDQDQPEVVQESIATLTVKSPIGIEGALSDIKGEIKEKKTNKSIPLSFEGEKAIARLTQGEAYTLNISASLITREIKAEIEYHEDFTADKATQFSKECQLSFQMPTSGFVISEIFFAGTRNRRGEQYDEDKFIKITNNSSVTRYADGLALLKSLWMSTEKKEGITPLVVETHFATDLVMQIPGSGHDYPVAPYESIILCHSALNHKETNPNSIDLSKANFEWMSDKGYTDSDTPDNMEVPNMLCLFISDPHGEGTVNWAMDNDGQYSYALANLQGHTAETLAKEYNYHYNEVMAIPGMDPMEMPGMPSLKIPNEWIIDAVNLSITNEHQWLPIDKSLDSGYAHVADESRDDSRYGKKVVRKPISKDAKQLTDTNNSTNDFIIVEIN